MKFVDIHTHKANCNTNVINIQNIIFGNERLIPKDYYSIGIHPWYIDTINKDELKTFTQLLQNKNCLSIGECGLDFQKNILQKFDIKEQLYWFEKQIEWGYQFHKPIIIHCVKCFDQLLQLKKQYPDTLPWIIHGYSKNKALANQLTRAGFYLSFGAALFTNKTNREALLNVPLNRFFLETDESSYTIEEIYKQASKVLQMEMTLLQKQILQNFISVFFNSETQFNNL